MKNLYLLFWSLIFGASTALAAESMPYSIDFNSADNKGWTAYDGDMDGQTWSYDSSYGGLLSRSNRNGTDDWYTSPKFNFETGVEYKITFNAEIASYYGAEINLNLVFGDKDSQTVLSNFVDIYYGWNREYSYTFTSDYTGEYPISIQNTSKGEDAIKLTKFTISSNKVELGFPYTQDFTTNMTGWTTVDANADGKTWQLDEVSYTGVYINQPLSTHDDWLISPEFTFEKEVVYQIVVNKTVFGGSGSMDNIEIQAGQGTDIDNYSLIGALNMTPGAAPDTIKFYFDSTVKRNIAIRNTCGIGSVWYIQKVVIEEEPEEVLDPNEKLHMDFTKTIFAKDWTIIDNNNDDNSWKFEDGATGISLTRSMESEADDWLISPEVELSSDEDYILSYKIEARGGFEDEIVNVYYGNNNTIEAMTNALMTEEIASEEVVVRYLKFRPATSGKYYIGFQGNSPARNGTISLHHVTLKISEGVRPLPPTEFNTESNIKQSYVRLSWTNPDTDYENIAISLPVNINIYRDNNLVTTVQGKAGEVMTYTDYPQPFEGETTYRLEAFCENNLLSESVEKTIVLDDFQGDVKLYRAWGGTENESFEDWTIENVDGYATYEFVSWSNNMQIKTKSERDDWMISPEISLTSNRRYIIKTCIQASINYASDFQLTIGPDTEVANHKVIKEIVAQGNGDIVYETEQFGIEESGTYRIGLRCTASRNLTYIKSIEIYYLENAADPLNLPYEEDFANDNALDQWVLGSASTFALSETQGFENNALVSISSNERDETIYSPMMIFRKGYEYEITFDHMFSGQSSDTNYFKMYMSKGQSLNELINDTEYSITGNGTATMRFVPDADGTYCMAFQLKTDLANRYQTVAIDNISVGSRVFTSLPYGEDFESYANGQLPTGWKGTTVCDGDAEGGQHALQISEYVSTPYFNHSDLRESYTLRFLVKKDSAPMTVKVSDGKNSVLLEAINEAYDNWTAKEIEITKFDYDKPYDFNIEFEYPGDDAYIDNVSIEMNERDIFAQAPTNFMVSYSIFNDNIILTWNNPEKETDGNPLTRDVTVNVYRNNEIIGSTTGAPGKSMSISMSNDNNFTNDVMIFRATSVVDENTGNSATTVYRTNIPQNLIEKYNYDFSGDEEWNNVDNAWDLASDGSNRYTVGNVESATLESPEFVLDSGKIYIVKYEFITSPDQTATFAVNIERFSNNDASQTFENVYLGKENNNQMPYFYMRMPRTETNGNYRIQFVASDINESVTVGNVTVYEEREYPGTCEIPYFNDFEDELVGTGKVAPNWYVQTTNNISPWGKYDMSNEGMEAPSGQYVLAAPNTEIEQREDIVFTPFFHMEQGYEYHIEYKIYKPGANTVLGFAYSDYRTSTDYGLISEYNDVVNEWTTITETLIPEGDFDVTFAFIAYSIAANDGIVAIDDFKITKTTSGIQSNVLPVMFFNNGTLSVPEQYTEVTIYDMQGKAVYTTGNNGNIDLSYLAHGVYIVKGTTANGEINTIKFIK